MPTLRSANRKLESPLALNSKSDLTPSKKRSSPRSTQEEDRVSPTAPLSKEVNGKISKCTLMCSPKSARKRLYGDEPLQKPKWNPKDPREIQAVKEALHVATIPTDVVCRGEEQNKIFYFCRDHFEKDKPGSLYVCGCPGTGKTLSIHNVKQKLTLWSEEMGYQLPNALAINCTSLVNTSEIFSKILSKFPSRQKTGNSNNLSHLQQLQHMFSQKKLCPARMILVIVDEMDYLINKDKSVLHDLFMLTTFPHSRCILIGVANSIDLADKFLPKLESLNCKPPVITFRAYNKEEISKIIQQRLKVLHYAVFDPLALEFCARKVAAASGDMRKALAVCRSAVELLEAELKDSSKLQEFDTVTFDHMETALLKAFKPPVVDTILCLPQHQQIILCALVKHFGLSKKKATTVGELGRSYAEICRYTQIPAVGTVEFTNLCRVLCDQGLMKLGQSKDDKLRRVTLLIDASDIIFAFKGNRFFQNCMQQQQ